VLNFSFEFTGASVQDDSIPWLLSNLLFVTMDNDATLGEALPMLVPW
jgi:hypothetical protein